MDDKSVYIKELEKTVKIRELSELEKLNWQTEFFADKSRLCAGMTWFTDKATYIYDGEKWVEQ